jgi:Protein of unknown function (DUF1420)
VALALAAIHLFVVFAILAISVAWGSRMLEGLRLQADSDLESLLFAAGFAVVSLEIILFGLAAAGWLRFGSAVAVLALMGVTAGRGWLDTWTLVRLLVKKARSALKSWTDRGMAVAVAAFLAVEALLAMAPLSGSDAMHYHFTVPLLEEGHRLLPIFWLTHSFFTGQGHLLISLGLALGSDRISLGLIYLGGLLAVGTVFALAQHLMPIRWAWVATLAFVATPLVFWQVGTSGSPDIWMSFFIPLAVLAAARAAGVPLSAEANPGLAPSANRWLLVAGFFAGAAAGVKYTGWIIPLGLAAWALAARRPVRMVAGTILASLAAGIWPLARNWVWTGDPVFPFLSNWFSPRLANSFALTAIQSLTSAEAFGRDLPHLVRFPFALVLQGDRYGLGQYFGPLVLAFAPLLIVARWGKPAARVAAIFWVLTFVPVLLLNQMGRFLLPVYPLALVLAFSGVAAAAERRWRIIVTGCVATAVVFLTFSAGADALYAKSFLPVVLGTETQEAFLQRMAPDYRVDEFIESTLRSEMDRADGGRVMVFYRHLYYLRVPFVEGAPEYSWLMNPSALNDPHVMFALLSRLDVRWIVRTEEYPETLDSVLSEMERTGQLMPMASAEIENLTGASRIYRQTENLHVLVLKVNDVR